MVIGPLRAANPSSCGLEGGVSCFGQVLLPQSLGCLPLGGVPSLGAPGHAPLPKSALGTAGRHRRCLGDAGALAVTLCFRLDMEESERRWEGTQLPSHIPRSSGPMNVRLRGMTRLPGPTSAPVLLGASGVSMPHHSPHLAPTSGQSRPHLGPPLGPGIPSVAPFLGSWAGPYPVGGERSP